MIKCLHCKTEFDEKEYTDYQLKWCSCGRIAVDVSRGLTRIVGDPNAMEIKKPPEGG